MRDTRPIYPNRDTCRIAFATNLSRFFLRNLIAVATAYWPLWVYARTLGIPYKDFCRSCNDEKKKPHLPLSSMSLHLALGNLRSRILWQNMSNQRWLEKYSRLHKTLGMVEKHHHGAIIIWQNRYYRCYHEWRSNLVFDFWDASNGLHSLMCWLIRRDAKFPSQHSDSFSADFWQKLWE